MHLRLPVTTARTLSKTTEQTSNAHAAKSVELGPTMSGSEILVACLEREGVDTIFAYPGGASMEIHQALTRSKKFAPSCRVTSKAGPLPPTATGG